MGFNIGSVFLELLADGARLKADIERQATAAADSAGKKAGLTLGQQLSTGLAKAGKTMAQTGMSLTRNLTLPIVAAGTAIVKTGIDFDTTLRQIVALTDTTASEIAGVRSQILELANVVGKDPTELARGFYFLASAGFDTAKAMEVLTQTAKASAAGMGDTADISRVVGAAINAFGKENLSASDAVDQLLRAVKDGTAEAPDFANALGQVLGTAGQMGATFADTTAAIAAMTLKGIDADTAAVSLNQVLVALLKVTPQAADGLKSVGLSAEGLRAELREKGLLAVLQTLEQAFQGNDTAASDVFGNVRALRGVLALTTGDAAQVARVFDDVANGTANLASAFADTEGPGRELDRAITEVKTTLIDLSTDVLPGFLEVMRSAAGLVKTIAGAFKSLPPEVRGGIVQLAGFAAIIGPTLVVLGKLSSGIGTTIGAFQKLAKSRAVGAAANAAGVVAGRLYAAAAATAETLGSAITSAWEKVPGSSRVVAASKRAGSFLGSTVGKAFSLALLAAAVIGIVETANAIEEETARQQGAIAEGVSKQITEANANGLRQSKAALEQGIRDLRANSAINVLLPSFTQEQVDALQRQLDLVNAKLKALDPTLASAGRPVGEHAGEAIAAGLKSAAPGVGSALAYYGEGIKAFGIDAGKSARAAGNRAGEALAQGITDARAKPRDAFDKLVQMIKDPNRANRWTEQTRLLGQLISKELALGLRSNDPAIQAQARATKQYIIDRLTELKTGSGKLTREQAALVEKGLKSKDPEIRAAAEAIKNYVESPLKQAANDAYGMGSRFTTLYANGLVDKAALRELHKQAAYVSGVVRQYMQVRSPSELGAFSEMGGPEGWGKRWGVLYAKGLGSGVGDINRVLAGLGATSGPTITAPGLPSLPGVAAAASAPGARSASLTVNGGIHLHGVGSDVSPAAAGRFGQSVLDVVASGLREQKARSAS